MHIFALFELHFIYLAFLRLIQEQNSSCENVSFLNTHLSRLNFEGTAKLKFVTLSTPNHFVACVTQAIYLLHDLESCLNFTAHRIPWSEIHIYFSVINSTAETRKELSGRIRYKLRKAI